MDFTLSDDQQMLLTAFDGLLHGYRQAPHGAHGYTCFSAAMQDEVRAAGFLDIATQPGFGLLDAALLVEAAASCPVSAELAASSMIGPLIDGPEGPIALAWGLGSPARYLDQARTVCLFDGDDVWVGTPQDSDRAATDSVAAYPLARLVAVPQGAHRLNGKEAEALRRRALIGIAVEAAGVMRGALEQTVQYVKDRHQFGHPLGHFQAIQHRLAEDAQIVQSAKWLSFRAAFDDCDERAATACLYAQVAMRKVIYDCHQFSGAMGLTLEFPLHLWTYRLKCLQGEAGGRRAQAQAVAASVWGTASHSAATNLQPPISVPA